MPYSPLLVKPMRDEMVEAGIHELLTAADVDKAMDQNGTILFFVNSVCGCAAGTARPAIRQLLEGDNQPDHIYTVFAGQDTEATAAFRHFIPDIPPSSPSFALFKDKELVYFIPKHRIEGRSADAVYNDLIAVMQEYA